VTTPSKRSATVPTESDAERVADAMFALSAPSRVRILGCLRTGPYAVGEITEAIGMEQSAVSHQLRVLRDHRLVRVERKGRRRFYALYDESVRALVDQALRLVETLAPPDHASRDAKNTGPRRIGGRLRRSAG
jgi:DNA-binding transcriptional ArsR family regulator